MKPYQRVICYAIFWPITIVCLIFAAPFLYIIDWFEIR